MHKIRDYVKRLSLGKMTTYWANNGTLSNSTIESAVYEKRIGRKDTGIVWVGALKAEKLAGSVVQSSLDLGDDGKTVTCREPGALKNWNVVL